jgi:hypothetical protein
MAHIYVRLHHVWPTEARSSCTCTCTCTCTYVHILCPRARRRIAAEYVPTYVSDVGCNLIAA